MRDLDIRLGIVIVCGFAFSCSAASADIDPSLVPVRKVVLRGQPAPGLGEEVFKDFSTSEEFSLNAAGAPCISAEGSIAFAATTRDIQQGVWASYSSGLTLLVVQGSQQTENGLLPLVSLKRQIIGAQPVWKGFLVTEWIPQRQSDRVAIALADAAGARIISSYYGSTWAGVVPDAQRSTIGYFGIGADDHGMVVINGGWNLGGYTGPCGFLVSQGQVVSQIRSFLAYRQQAPGFPQGTQTVLSNVLLVGGQGRLVLGGNGTVNQTATNSALWLSDAHSSGLLVRGNAIMPGWIANTGFVNSTSYGAVGTISVNAQGVAAFSGSVNTSGGRRRGVWFGTEVLVMPAAAEGEEVRSMGPGWTMGAPRLPRINDWVEMAFVAPALGPSGPSVCVWTGGVAEWFPVAREGAPVPVANSSCTFESIDTSGGLRINNLGQVAFRAVTIDSQGVRSQGVWVHDPISGLRKVVTEGDVLQTESGATSRVTSVAFTSDESGDVRQTGLNNSGTLVFAATTEDSAGVFTVDLNRLFCRADLNRDGVLDISDIFRFLDLYFSGSPRGDFDGSGTLSAGDFYRYIDLWVSGC